MKAHDAAAAAAVVFVIVIVVFVVVVVVVVVVVLNVSEFVVEARAAAFIIVHALRYWAYVFDCDGHGLDLRPE
jgi:hypothetical protein